MASKRQTDNDFESLTIRIPTWLKGSLERIKGSIAGVSTVSDAARLVMETGAGSVEPSGDIRELLELQQDEQQSLQRIVAKWHHGEQIYSRAELAFIGQWAHRAYMHITISNVQRSPIQANLQAFASVRSLRNERYKQSEITERRDSYYHGNLGNSGAESIDEKLNSTISSLKEFPYSSHAEFASRCLEVALRNEPVLPGDRLNELLRPHLAPLIKLALRAYLLSKERPAVPIDSSFNIGSVVHPKAVTKGRISISPNILGDSMTAAIIWEGGNLIVAVNSFVELNELLILTNAVKHEHQATGSRFHLFSPMAPISQYVMRVGGVQIAFQDSEFDDMRTALAEVMSQPVMKAEYERLSWIYGEV